jgi:hypothetical protein
VEQRSHIVARFVNALMMVTELVPHTVSEDLPAVVRIACLEDWFTNHRVLIEFLLLGPPKNCARAQDFVPDWEPASSREIQRLKADYGFASEHVSHIGVPKPKAMTQNVAPPILVVKAIFLLDVAEEFADALTTVDADLAGIVRVGIQGARGALAAGGN